MVITNQITDHSWAVPEVSFYKVSGEPARKAVSCLVSWTKYDTEVLEQAKIHGI